MKLRRIFSLACTNTIGCVSDLRIVFYLRVKFQHNQQDKNNCGNLHSKWVEFSLRSIYSFYANIISALDSIWSNGFDFNGFYSIDDAD